MVAKIKDTDAAKNALLVRYAEDMYEINPNDLKPPPDPRIEEDGWHVLGYLNSTDAVIPKEGGPISFGAKVFFGYVAESMAGPLRYVVVIRGTKRFLEWIENVKFGQVKYKKGYNAFVERGFFGIFERMSYVNNTGNTYNDALEGIQEATKKGAGSITVIGASLGAALATYTALGLVLKKEEIKNRVNACLIASPRPGDPAFSDLFQKNLGGCYKLYNYERDIVPKLPPPYMPPSIYYSSLKEEMTIRLSDAQAQIINEIICNHNTVCYAAMLDFHLRDWTQLPPHDQDCTRCIKGENV